jgi:hypothetical protein
MDVVVQSPHWYVLTAEITITQKFVDGAKKKGFIHTKWFPDTQEK